MFKMNKFISENVTKRSESMFHCDVKALSDRLETKIQNKRILVIGGAGSIDSSFVKAILTYKPKSLVVLIKNYKKMLMMFKNKT